MRNLQKWHENPNNDLTNKAYRASQSLVDNKKVNKLREMFTLLIGHCD